MCSNLLDRAREQVHLADEAGDPRVHRPVVQDIRGPVLEDEPIAHHGHPVGHRERLILVVGHEDEGDAQLLLELLELQLHLTPELEVERTQGFVEEQHRRPVDERSGQGDALLLTATQLPRPAPFVSGQPHQLQRLADATRCSCRLGLGLRCRRP